MLKTKSDLYRYLTDLRFELYYKAEIASDIKNPEAAAELNQIADYISTITKRLATELENTND